MILYEVPANATRAKSKSALQDRASKIRKLGFSARVIRVGDKYKLYTNAYVIKDAGMSIKGLPTRRFKDVIS